MNNHFRRQILVDENPNGEAEKYRFQKPNQTGRFHIHATRNSCQPRATEPTNLRVNQTDATAVRRRERMPSGFVNCAADDTAPFRLARMLRVGSNKNSPLPFLLANAHVAGCGWLGIHEADYEAFDFGTALTAFHASKAVV